MHLIKHMTLFISYRDADTVTGIIVDYRKYIDNGPMQPSNTKG